VSPLPSTVISLVLALAGNDPRPADIPEPGSAEAIAAATSDPRFLSPWVASLPDSPTVPSPRDFLGRIAGAPGELADTVKAYGYCRALAAASPRVRLFTIGKSEEGRDILLLAIADEAGIADLERLKAATAALADPRRTDPAAADRLIETARPIYYLNAALHADETGSTEAMLELAYRLAVSEQPMIQRIRRELVVLINPVSNPDGRDRVVEWYYRFLKGKTDWATLPRVSPPYWSNYAFVDINRDTHQQTHEATKAVHRMFHEWHPTVVHDLHEAFALLLTWNGTGPYNPNIDPITYGEFLELSFHEVRELTALGMPGVWTWKFGEGFGHHYLDSVAMNHNSLGRGYETWGNTTPERIRRELRPSQATTEWYRPLPPPRVFEWSARDNVNYTETATLSALEAVAGDAKTMLRDFYRKGWNSWHKGVSEPPYAFVIPDDQGDRARVAAMVERLLAQRIEVSRALRPLSLREGRFETGSYVVRLDQPYRNYAVDLLSPQQFPKNGGRPYDDISWELPAHYSLEALPIADPAVSRLPADVLAPLAEAPRPAGRVDGAGPAFLLKDTGQEAFLAARYRLSAFRLDVATRPFRLGAAEWRPARGSCRRRTGYRPRSVRWPRISASTSQASQRRPTFHGPRPPRRASASSCRGPTPTRSAGSATRSTSDACPTSISATRTSAPGGCAIGWTSWSTATSTWSSPSRSRVCRSSVGRCPTRKRPRRRATEFPRSRTTSRAASATKASRTCSASWRRAASS
jgi:hypothetical protein